MNTIFISGGATGIGAACVAKFISEGWNVTFIDIDTEHATALCAQINKPDHLLFCHADTRNRSSIEEAVKQCINKFGRLDAIFANAGIHRKNTILDIDDAELDLLIDINIKGNINTLRAALPAMIECGNGGAVVINASDQVFVGKGANFGYGMTKGALGQITRSLAIDLAQYGIRVNAVCPGTIHTPLVDKVFEGLSARTGKSVEEYIAEENKLFTRGTMGQADEVARMVYFLAGSDSSFCNGAHYLIDGGLVAGR